ncbi:MAG: molybdenum cofactor biosynthesis protein [Haloarculaceae archaeon]
MTDSPGTDAPPDPATAREALLAAADPLDRTDRVPVTVSVGRTLAADATARKSVTGALDAGEAVYSAGHRIRPGDVGVLAAAGIEKVAVVQRPEVGVVPLGEPGTTTAATALGLAQYVDRWSGKVTLRDAVPASRPALRPAVQRDLTRDGLAFVGTEPGDALRDVVGDLGAVRCSRVAIEPGGDAGIAVVRERPVLLSPPSPVGARVAAVQLLRPLVRAFAGDPPAEHPTRTVSLTAHLETDPERTSFVPVELEDGSATPLSGRDRVVAARADGWVTVPAGESERERGASVAVADWDYLP